MTVDIAREKATELLADIIRGADPVKDKAAQRAVEAISGLSVEGAIDLFAKGKVRRVYGQKLPLKESTLYSYRKTIKALIGEDRYKAPLVKLDEETIAKCVKEHKGKSSASTGCRSLSAVWNWLGKQKDYRGQLPANPVKEYALYNDGLHVPAPKQSRIEREEMADWFAQVETFPEISQQLYLWLMFTGNRAGEALNLDWQDINWKTKTYRLNSKNRREITLPLPPYLLHRIKRRRKSSGRVFDVSEGNFRRQRTEKAFKHWTAHDLRRTFSGVAQAVCSYSTVKRLLNHTYTDITEIYIGQSADLGAEIEKVGNEILRLAESSASNVVRMEEVS